MVAGGTGVVGAPLGSRLRGAGHEVLVLGRKGPDLVADALDGEGVKRSMVAAKPEGVIHQLTAIPKRLDPRKVDRDFAPTSRLRTEGTRNLIAGARAAGTRRFICQSVAFLCPPGDGLAGEDVPIWSGSGTPAPLLLGATAEGERLVSQAPFDQKTVLRYGLFGGPGTAWAADGQLTGMVRKRRIPIVGHGEGRMSFVHVDDAASGTLPVLEKGVSGVLHIVEDDPPTAAQALRQAAVALGAKPPRRVPGWLARPVAGRYAVFSRRRMRGADNRAARALGWVPARSFMRDFPDFARTDA